jgi:hypothetical protein
MLSAVTVMGQAKKCNEFEDRLRNLRIRDQFIQASYGRAAPDGNLLDEPTKLATLKIVGALSEEEFASAKARLIGS